MLKVVQGIYKDGNVAVKVDELPDDIAESTAIVVFVKNNIRKMEILKKLASCVSDESDEIKIDEKEYNALSKALDVSDMDESKTEQELDAQDNIQWNLLFKKTQSKLIAVAEKAKQEIDEGKAVSMDYDKL
ncbi:MAG: hypothetical protein AAB116_22770 [Candidatus Poribacteria bacterium]